MHSRVFPSLDGSYFRNARENIMAEIPPKIKAKPVHIMILNTPNKGWKMMRKEKIRVRIPPVNTHPQLRTFKDCI